MSDSAMSEQCPACSSKNWLALGDMNDMTGTDPEAIRCWKCKHVWLIEGAEEFTTLDDAMVDDGRRVLR